MLRCVGWIAVIGWGAAFASCASTTAGKEAASSGDEPAVAAPPAPPIADDEWDTLVPALDPGVQWVVGRGLAVPLIDGVSLWTPTDRRFLHVMDDLLHDRVPLRTRDGYEIVVDVDVHNASWDLTTEEACGEYSSAIENLRGHRLVTIGDALWCLSRQGSPSGDWVLLARIIEGRRVTMMVMTPPEGQGALPVAFEVLEQMRVGPRDRAFGAGLSIVVPEGFAHLTAADLKDYRGAEVGAARESIIAAVEDDGTIRSVIYAADVVAKPRTTSSPEVCARASSDFIGEAALKLESAELVPAGAGNAMCHVVYTDIAEAQRWQAYLVDRAEGRGAQVRCSGDGDDVDAACLQVARSVRWLPQSIWWMSDLRVADDTTWSEPSRAGPMWTATEPGGAEVRMRGFTLRTPRGVHIEDERTLKHNLVFHLAIRDQVLLITSDGQPLAQVLGDHEADPRPLEAACAGIHDGLAAYYTGGDVKLGPTQATQVGEHGVCATPLLKPTGAEHHLYIPTPRKTEVYCKVPVPVDHAQEVPPACREVLEGLTPRPTGRAFGHRFSVKVPEGFSERAWSERMAHFAEERAQTRGVFLRASPGTAEMVVQILPRESEAPPIVDNKACAAAGTEVFEKRGGEVHKTFLITRSHTQKSDLESVTQIQKAICIMLGSVPAPDGELIYAEIHIATPLGGHVIHCGATPLTGENIDASALACLKVVDAIEPSDEELWWHKWSAVTAAGR